MHTNWHFPTEIFLSSNEILKLHAHLESINSSNPIVIVDKFLASAETIQLAFKENNISLKNIFTEFSSNPTDNDIQMALAQAANNNNDAVVCIGGGSALDTGKTVALCALQDCGIWDLEDIGDNYKNADTTKILPIIAVPTTAGTGSEVGRAAAIIDAKTAEKKLIFHPQMLPSIVIADPILHLSLPPELTAATGIDAFAHSLEAYCAPGFHPMADGIAIAAMKIIKENLQTAFAKPNDLNARTNMLAASIMGASAFQKGLGAIHSLSHPVGGLYRTHHGLLNAIFMLPVLDFNKDYIDKKISYLAHCLELQDASFDGFKGWLANLFQQIKIPKYFDAINIDAKNIDLICARAMQDPSTPSNPRPLTKNDFIAIFTNALQESHAPKTPA
jgi:alcohol dehydrogenase class IV